MLTSPLCPSLEALSCQEVLPAGTPDHEARSWLVWEVLVSALSPRL